MQCSMMKTKKSNRNSLTAAPWALPRAFLSSNVRFDEFARLAVCDVPSLKICMEDFMKRSLVMLFGLFIIVGALLACGDSSANTGSVAIPGGTTASTQHFGIGKVVKVGSTWEVTVNSVKTSGGDDFTKPASGNTFLIVNVTVHNISNTEQSISSLLNFKVKDDTGTEGKTALLTTGVSPAPDGKIAAGDKSKGDLVNEVSASQKKFTLAFEADIVGSGQTIWDLSV